jgi:hypothetical protein
VLLSTANFTTQKVQYGELKFWEVNATTENGEQIWALFLNHELQPSEEPLVVSLALAFQ